MPDDLDIRRRRLAFRAWHRGTREADLLLGRFADRHLPGFAVAELDRFEALLGESDPDIWAWVSGRASVARGHDTPVFRLLKDFSTQRN